INEGRHHREVAAKFSVKPHIIQCLCRAARRRGETVLVWRCKLTPAQRTEVVHQFNSGRTRSELAHEFGVSKRTVATILSEARATGVKIRRAYSPAVFSQAASAPPLICCATLLSSSV